MRIPSTGPIPVMIIAAVLVIVLVALGVNATDVRQIFSDFSALAALYVLQATKKAEVAS